MKGAGVLRGLGGGGPWLLPGAGLPLRVAAPRVLAARLRRPGPRHRGARGRRGRCPALARPDRLSVHPRQEHNVFYGHHAKIVCLAWSPDNEHLASGGMDMMVYVWTLSDPETRVKIQGDSRTRLSRPRSSSEAAPRHWPPACSVRGSASGQATAVSSTRPRALLATEPERGGPHTQDSAASGATLAAPPCSGCSGCCNRSRRRRGRGAGAEKPQGVTAHRPEAGTETSGGPSGSPRGAGLGHRRLLRRFSCCLPELA